MRHRLFHAIVMVGASLPVACSDDASSAPTADSGSPVVDSGVADSFVADTATTDTGSSTPDTGTPDTGTTKPDTAMPDAPCDGECGCFPCIK